MNKLHNKILCLLLSLSTFTSIGAATSPISLTSGNEELTEGFLWAKELALTYVATGREGVPYPCYQGSYAHDFQYCIRDISHQAEAGHLLGLDLENFTMLKRFAESANNNKDNCRLRWPAWKFEFLGPGSNFTPELPTPFELAERAFEQYQWTNDKKWLNDPVFAEFFRFTNNELMIYLDANKNGIVDIATIKNKCGDGLASYWEFPLKPSNEAGDAIGSQYQSLLGYANILETNGKIAEAKNFRDKANAIKATFEKDWYIESEGRYASGFTEDGTPLTGWTHEQCVFILLKRISDMGPRTQNFIDFVHSCTYNEGINIEATTYYPEAFYHHKANHIGWSWLLYDIRSRNIYPEVPFLVIRNTVCGLMGVSADAPNKKVFTLPRLVNDVPWVEVSHIPVGSYDLNVRHDGETKTTLKNNSSEAIKWEVQFYGKYTTIKVDGVAKATKQKEINGHTVSFVEVSVAGNKSVVAEAQPMPVSKFVYISDLPWIYTGKVGATRKDNCATGYVLTMQNPLDNSNKTYEKGIGMEKNQEVSFDLDGKYFLFTAEIGFDKAGNLMGGMANQSGNVTFIVEADGAEIYNSGELATNSRVQKIVLNVAGKKKLKLMCKASGNAYNIYTNWANARLTTEESTFIDLSCDGFSNDTNGDGIFDAGEKAKVKVNIANLGFINSASDTKVTCSALGESAQYVTIANPASIDLGSIAPNVKLERTFDITLAQNTPKKTRIELMFVVTEGNSSYEMFHSYLTPHAVMDIKFKGISEIESSWGDNLLEPGDKGKMNYTIYNTGNSSSDKIKLSGTSSSDYMKITNKEITIEPIAKGDSALIALDFALSATTPANRSMKVSLSLYDKNGEEFIKSIDKTYITPSAKYIASFNALENTSNQESYFSIGGTSNLSIKVANKGNKAGNDAVITVEKVDENKEMYTITTTEFALGKIDVDQEIIKTFAIEVAPNAVHGSLISMRFIVNDGATRTAIVKVFRIGTVYCSDMKWSEEKTGYTGASRDYKVMTSSNIRLKDVIYNKGIGVHATSEITIDLNGKYKQFISDVGIDGSIAGQGSCAFQVFLDDVKAWESSVLKAGDEKESCVVDVTGAQKMKLVVTDGGDGINSDHGDWAGAYLTSDFSTDTEKSMLASNSMKINPSLIKSNDPLLVEVNQAIAGRVVFNLFSETGRTIASTSEFVVQGNNHIIIPTNGFSKGMYIVQMIGTDGNTYISKVFIK